MNLNRVLWYFLIFMAGYFLWMSFFGPRRQNSTPKEVQKTVLHIPSPDSTVAVELPDYSLRISPAGGYISHIEIKKYGATIVDGHPLLYFPSRGERLYTIEAKESRIDLSDSTDSFSYIFGQNYTISIENSDTIVKLYNLLHGGNRNEEARLSGLIYYDGKKVHSISDKKLKNGFSITNPVWFGYRSQFFSFIILSSAQEVKARADDGGNVEITARLKQKDYRTYLGPIDPDIMKRVDPSLYNVFNWGNFLIAPFTKFIFYTFRFLHNFIPNLGWVIILFALLMKLVFSPLTYTSYKSMAKMREIQPKLKQIQQVYKDDPQKMQEEMMKLYKEHGVNPFGGCLPLLIQLPIFWGLYNVLKDSIDFWNAPFMLWIQDLSAKDPYYILPIIMGLVTLANTFMQPTADRNARMIGIIMAAVFVFIFMNFPSGLVLYWLAYSTFSVVEQYIFRRIMSASKQG